VLLGRGGLTGPLVKLILQCMQRPLLQLVTYYQCLRHSELSYDGYRLWRRVRLPVWDVLCCGARSGMCIGALLVLLLPAICRCY
jgi:hypothetical protein